MKRTILALSCLVGISAFAQDNLVDVVIDGKPAKMNTTTGVYTFTNGAPDSYTSNNTVTTVTEKANPNVEAKTVLDSKIHTVVKGETLYSISKKYEISMAHIKSLNNLSSNVLSVNQQLKIGYNTKAEISNNSVYIVKKGDSLFGIAKREGLSVAELKQLNGLETNIIKVGQELKLK
ncbi:LysM peptidoglycan-binding domain-containing protein [Lacinutrix venerupis]|uniref:LysM peptidoglycan-binding domain-containing protein n=1 Tax=Lacinutrix venerupis TaxID=1486034 RepID=UPI0009FB5C5F|nr:LysM peptidoglycan-binding domain-containing protein [Lacinutrix venerupis]